MPQTATIKSLPAAFRMMKATQAGRVEWGEDYRVGARDALAALLRGRMDRLIDDHLERMADSAKPTGATAAVAAISYRARDARAARAPARTFSALSVVRAYARPKRDRSASIQQENDTLQLAVRERRLAAWQHPFERKGRRSPE